MATFGVLCVAVPAIFLAALAARRPVPAMSAWPSALQPAAATSAGTSILEEAGPLPGSVLKLAAIDDRLVVTLDALPAPGAPDLLVYWSASPESSALADATLLGVIGDTGRPWVFELPTGAAGEGHLVLFSLAYGEVVGSTRLALPAPGTR